MAIRTQSGAEFRLPPRLENALHTAFGHKWVCFHGLRRSGRTETARCGAQLANEAVWNGGNPRSPREVVQQIIDFPGQVKSDLHIFVPCPNGDETLLRRIRSACGLLLVDCLNQLIDDSKSTFELNWMRNWINWHEHNSAAANLNSIDTLWSLVQVGVTQSTAIDKSIKTWVNQISERLIEQGYIATANLLTKASDRRSPALAKGMSAAGGELKHIAQVLCTERLHFWIDFQAPIRCRDLYKSLEELYQTLGTYRTSQVEVYCKAFVYTPEYESSHAMSFRSVADSFCRRAGQTSDLRKIWSAESSRIALEDIATDALRSANAAEMAPEVTIRTVLGDKLVDALCVPRLAPSFLNKTLGDEGTRHGISQIPGVFVALGKKAAERQLDNIASGQNEAVIRNFVISLYRACIPIEYVLMGQPSAQLIGVWIGAFQRMSIDASHTIGDYLLNVLDSRTVLTGGPGAPSVTDVEMCWQSRRKNMQKFIKEYEPILSTGRFNKGKGIYIDNVNGNSAEFQRIRHALATSKMSSKLAKKDDKNFQLYKLGNVEFHN
jgi:hypothetical protein